MATSQTTQRKHWLCPIGQIEEIAAATVVTDLIAAHSVFAFRKGLKAASSVEVGDAMVFYAKGLGVVACAKAGNSREWSAELPEWMSGFHNVFDLLSVRVFLDTPFRLDCEENRQKLEAFHLKNELALQRWAWFVQSLHSITKHDFEILTQS